MSSCSADNDPLLAARGAAPQPHVGADDVGSDSGCQVIQGPAQPPVTRNGVLLLPARQVSGPVDLELVNRWRDGAS